MTPLVSVFLVGATGLLTLALAIKHDAFPGYQALWPDVLAASLVLYAIGAVLAIVHWNQGRKKNAPISPVPLQQTDSPVLAQTANPTINVNIGAQPESQKAAAPPSSPPKTGPNIHLVEVRIIDAYIANGDFHETEDGLGDFRFAIACFRNDGIVGQRVGQPQVKAHIIYRDAAGNEITDVPRGVWLGEYRDHAEFTIGRKQCLVLCLLSNQGTLKKLWKESYTHSQSWMSGSPSFRVGDAGIRGQIASIEIILLETVGTSILQTIFDVAKEYSEGEFPELKVRTTSAS